MMTLLRPGHWVSLSLTLSFLNTITSADSIDWVNPRYLLQTSKDPSTVTQRQEINRYADITGKRGPWVVAPENNIKPPNGDTRDYLSWAPYHWPDCDWCSGSRSRAYAVGAANHTRGNVANVPPVGSDGLPPFPGTLSGQPILPPGLGPVILSDPPALPIPSTLPTSRNATTNTTTVSTEEPSGSPTEGTENGSKRMVKRIRRQEQLPGAQQQALLTAAPTPTSFPPIPDITSLLNSGIHTASSTTSEKIMSETPNPAQAQARTDKPKATKTHGGDSAKSTCTPSPARSLGPSATWTSCPYVTKDGKANPDVREPGAVEAVVELTQAIQSNAFAFAFTNKPNYAASVSTFIRKFFLDPKVGMNPRVNYGQVIRGPGEQKGQYLGILDFRGMVKVANAVRLLKLSGVKEWDATTDAQFKDWVSKYVSWLQTSDIGKKGNDAPNNHGSFYASQLAAMTYMIDDKTAATTALNTFFKKQLLDQIAASGEQPFEAVRTRPYHYRCFNLEALITSAKLGDELGLDLWTAKSKYGATIQTALDFVMAQNPKNEDVSDIFPHVAAIAAAYGDPSGRYDRFLKNNDKDYGKAPYYLYNSPRAFKNSPSVVGSNGASAPSPGNAAGASPDSGKGKGNRNNGKGHNKDSRDDHGRRAKRMDGLDEGSELPLADRGAFAKDPTISRAPTPTNGAQFKGSVPSNSPDAAVSAPSASTNPPDAPDAPGGDNSTTPTDPADGAVTTPTIPWQCPIAAEPRAQLDDGVYVTCDELKPLYGYTQGTAP